MLRALVLSIDGALRQEPEARAAAYPEDLRLARACAEGDAAAQSAFDREVLPMALRAAARILPTADARDELAQILRERLFQGQPERPARIGDYDGSVPLISWVRVIARRCGLNLRESKQRNPESLDEHLEKLAQSGTPESALGHETFRKQFRAAFIEAVARLSSRDRAVLRLHLAEGVTLEGVAAAYGVHRATAARWIAIARTAVMERTRQALALGLGASEAELDSLLRDARSHLDVSISAVFRSSTT